MGLRVSEDSSDYPSKDWLKGRNLEEEARINSLKLKHGTGDDGGQPSSDALPTPAVAECLSDAELSMIRKNLTPG